MKEDTKSHKSQIQFIVWDHDTSRFAAGDRDGVVTIWKVSKHNGLTLLYTHTPPRPTTASVGIFLRKTSPNVPWIAFGGGKLLHILWTDEKGAPPPPSAPHKGLIAVDLTHQAQGPLVSLHQSTNGEELLVATGQPNAILLTFRFTGPLSVERTSLRIVAPSTLPSVPSSTSLVPSGSSSPSGPPAAPGGAAAASATGELAMCWVEDALVVVDPSASSLSVWSISSASNSGPSATLSTKSMQSFPHLLLLLLLTNLNERPLPNYDLRELASLVSI